MSKQKTSKPKDVFTVITEFQAKLGNVYGVADTEAILEAVINVLPRQAIDCESTYEWVCPACARESLSYDLETECEICGLEVLLEPK